MRLNKSSETTSKSEDTEVRSGMVVVLGMVAAGTLIAARPAQTYIPKLSTNKPTPLKYVPTNVLGAKKTIIQHHARTQPRKKRTTDTDLLAG